MAKRKYINGFKKLTDKTDVSFKGSIYIIMAYRWSDINDHNYIVGVYKTLESAISNAHHEARERGGKYGCIIYATQRTNKHVTERMVAIYEIESPYKGRAGKNLNK